MMTLMIPYQIILLFICGLLQLLEGVPLAQTSSLQVTTPSPGRQPVRPIRAEGQPLHPPAAMIEGSGDRDVAYDQRQAGKYNIHISIKDVALVEMGRNDLIDESYNMDDYYYDDNDLTVKPLSLFGISSTTSKPSSTTTSTMTTKATPLPLLASSSTTETSTRGTITTTTTTPIVAPGTATIYSPNLMADIAATEALHNNAQVAATGGNNNNRNEDLLNQTQTIVVPSKRGNNVVILEASTAIPSSSSSSSSSLSLLHRHPPIHMPLNADNDDTNDDHDHNDQDDDDAATSGAHSSSQPRTKDIPIHSGLSRVQAATLQHARRQQQQKQIQYQGQLLQQQQQHDGNVELQQQQQQETALQSIHSNSGDDSRIYNLRMHRRPHLSSAVNGRGGGGGVGRRPCHGNQRREANGTCRTQRSTPTTLLRRLFKMLLSLPLSTGQMMSSTDESRSEDDYVGTA